MTQAEFLALGLVAERPAHGYQLERSARALGVPPVGRSTVYLALRNLESRGAVEALMEPGARGPARNRFSITPAGRELLHRQIQAELDSGIPPDLALLFLSRLETPAARSALDAYGRRLDAQLASVREAAGAGSRESWASSRRP